MKAQIKKIYGDTVSEEEVAKAIKEAGDVIRAGELVAFPTETVYGLGADALNSKAVKKIYAAKGRPPDNPLTIHIASIHDLDRIAKDIPEAAKKLVAHYWPGPLTVVLKKTKNVPPETTGGKKTVAVRMPDHPVALALIRESGGFVAAPSANRSGRPSPTTAQHVAEDMAGRIPLILDGGAVGIGIESTIVDFTEDMPKILRPGFITYRMVEDAVGEAIGEQEQLTEAAAAEALKRKNVHYAPKAEMIVFTGTPERVAAVINEKARFYVSQGKQVGILCTDETRTAYVNGKVLSVGSMACQEQMARNFFAALREFDAGGVDVILSECFGGEGIGQAIRDRLLKAAKGHVYPC